MEQKPDTHTEEVSPEDNKSRSTSPSLLGVGLALLLATATFFSGLHIGTDTNLEANVFSILSPKEAPDEEADLREFWRVWNTLEEKYVDTSATTSVSAEERLEGAIDGLVRSYNDPYTTYLPPEETALFEEDISGNFSGVGMEVGVRNNVVTVIAPLPNSPAEEAGLMSGDMIVRINDESTEGMGIDEAVRLIRGEAGTTVTLSIYREGEQEFREVSVVRDIITIPTSRTETRGDTFIVTLYSFNALAEAEMQRALREYVRSDADNLVLDLRGNPGGYLQSAVAISSYFLPLGKTVVREHFGDATEERVYRSSGKEIGSFSPETFVVLVDGGSASASEIVAGALQEHGVATLVGSQTFGKGSVQELVKLGGGSSLKVTIARWLTPDGVSISEGGLTPDIVVERTAEDRMENRDPQLEAALEFLGE